MIKFGALWKGKDKDNQPTLSGQVNDNTRILILKNGFKKEPNHPDYIVYLVENERKPKAATAAPKTDQPAEDF